MSKENQKEVEVVSLPVEVLTSCKSISVELSASHETHLTADKRMNTASALMLKLMGLKPDYNLLKQVQQVILNSLVNDHKLALTTSEKLFSQMLKQVQFANPKFVKPSKPTKDGLRMSAKRKELKEKYIHEALESVEAKLAKVNRVIGQAFIDNVKTKEDDIKKAIIHIPIPGEYMNSEEGKDSFVEEIMPSIFKEVNKKFSPYGIAWASEAWVRIADKDFNTNKDNWQALPIKKEVLFISIETEFKKEVNVYNIKRLGHKVNSDGEIVDNISLEEETDFGNPENVGGRFSGLYKKLIKNETN